MIGIYVIRNRLTDRQYIGSSADCERRWKQHRALLNRGAHPTPRLQAAWLRDGEVCFEFSVIEECASAELKDREQWWLDTVKPFLSEAGYNEMSSTWADWSNAEYRRLMSAAAKRRANTDSGRRQIKTARARRTDYSMMSRVRSLRGRGNQFRLWDPEELSFMGENFGWWSAEEIGRVLDRSVYSINVQAFKMGLRSKGTAAFSARMRVVSLDRERKRREATA
jgi:group I intron endonuclease